MSNSPLMPLLNMIVAEVFSDPMRISNGHDSVKNHTHYEQDLKEEYDLIMKKKSKLSANMRRFVVCEYEKMAGINQ